MRDPCEDCAPVSGYRDCSVCRFNEENWRIPTKQERNRSDYWEEIARINNIGVTDPGWKFRPVDYDTSYDAGFIKSQTSSDCAEMMYLFNSHYNEIKKSNGAYYVALIWDALQDALVRAGYLTLYQAVIVDDSDFDEDLPF